MWKKLTPYRSSTALLLALIVGILTGIFFPSIALTIKPIGQIFLNLLFVIIVPLVGIGVMSSIAEMTDLRKLRKLLTIVLCVSVVMALIPAAGILGLAHLFDPAQGVVITLGEEVPKSPNNIDFVNMFTTDDFAGLMSKSNILALVIVSILGGIAVGQAKERGKAVAELLKSANEVIMNTVGLIMKGAPVGLGAFFAATIAEQDTTLLPTFANTAILFFVAVSVYFVIGSTIYSYIGSGVQGVKLFWKVAAEPSFTALGTCSSLGTLPVTIRAAKNMGIQEEMADICLPLLVNLNKGGVAMITALKIIFIYSVLGLPFTFDVFITTMVIAVLSAVVISGVPGGILSSVFITTTLGLPMEVIPMLVVIGTVTDAPSTLLNAVHDLNATQIVERFMGKHKNDTKTS